MSEFFDGLGKKISGAADTIGHKTEDFIAIQGLKSQKHKAQEKANKDLIELGKIVHAKYKAGVEIAEEAKPLCEDIDTQRGVIEDLNKKIDEYGDEE